MIEAIEAHKRVLRHEVLLRTEATTLVEAANRVGLGEGFALRQKAQRCRDRAFGASMRASGIEDTLCTLAEKDERAYAYVEAFYRTQGVWQDEAATAV